MSYEEAKLSLANQYAIYKQFYDNIDTVDKYYEDIEQLNNLAFEYRNTFNNFNVLYPENRSDTSIFTDDDIDEQMISLLYKLKLN